MAKKLLSDIERFWKSIVIGENDCWNWQKFIDEDGYGHFKVNKRSAGAHRWSYEYHSGPIPNGLEIDHLCRNRACVNPLHLEPVTPLVNTRRGWRASKPYCVNGHALAGSNLGIAKATGWRFCLICQRAAIRKHYRKTGGAAQKKFDQLNREKRRLDQAARRAAWTPERLDQERERGRIYDAIRRKKRKAGG